MKLPNEIEIMTQEDIDLLLKDLCARLPYRVKVTYTEYSGREDCILNSQHLNSTYAIENLGLKPYLRPLLSMTKGEQEILEDFGVTISPFSGQIRVPFNDMEFPFITMQKIISYLYSIHIDINGLIPKGLAIEVTRENNPYKD